MDQISIGLLQGVSEGATLRAMAQQVGLASAATVHRRLRQLVDAGYIEQVERDYILTAKGQHARANPDAYPDVTAKGRGHGLAYTDKEKAILRECAGRLNAEAIAALLPGRSVQSVKTAAQKLGVSLKVLR